MKFKYTILYVRNVEQALVFYEEAFGFERKFLHESADYGELDTGDTTLAFCSLQLMENLGKKPGKANPGNPVFEIALETGAVEQALQKAVTAGAVLVQDIQQQPWGQTTSYVSDTDGVLIEICSPILHRE